MSDINETLEARARQYGDFSDIASLSQRMKSVMACNPNWTQLNNSQKESLEMIVHKIARIINGNPNLIDSWHDISGYAKLIENTLTEENE